MEAKIFLNTFYQILGKIIISLLGIISTAYLTRYLGVNLFGEYNLIFAIVGFAAIFADFGLSTLLVRELAAKRANEIFFAHIFTLRFLISILIFTAASLLTLIFPYSTLAKIGVFIASIGNIFLLLSSIFWSVFQAELKFKKIILIQTFTSFLVFVLTLFGVFLKLDLLFFVIIAVLGNAISFFISFYLVNPKKLFLIDIKKIIIIAKTSLPLGIGVVVSVAYFKVDMLILSFFYNPVLHHDVGWYSLAYKIFEVALVFGGFFTQTLFPFFSENISKGDFLGNFKKFLIYTFAISIFLSIIMFFSADLFVFILGGTAFAPSAEAIKILSFGLGPTILAGFFLTVAVAGKKQVALAKFAVAALIINVLGNIFVIPQYSFIGASWMTVMTQIFILLANMYIAIRVVKEASI